MTHYKSDLDDIYYNLFNVLGVQNYTGDYIFTDVDAETSKTILAQIKDFSETTLAESFTEADRTPPIYTAATHTVTMPEKFADTYRKLMDAQWWQLELPPELGGVNVPSTVRWSAAEMMLGANPAAFLYSTGPFFAAILHRLGNDAQKTIAQHMVDRLWGATMVLTEPDAGSDVGAGTTKATLQEDGTWHITGVKRFITSGEHGMSDNILHFVLARPDNVVGAGGPGTKGLSLFLVPKTMFDIHDGELSTRNGVYATNVEKKMGLKASTTCEMSFGIVDDEPAVGWLVGDVHDGIAQMFTIIEYARMMVGTKAIGTLSTGYLNAVEYAKTRIQGTDLTETFNKQAPKVPIIDHPDVRRDLMMQKSYAEGLRAMMLYTAYWQDMHRIAEAEGNVETAATAESVNDFLLPLVKGVGSERSYEMLAKSLQTFGGSGYLQDYPIEQYIRDSKIDTLYEGTTAIQGLDFFFRKILKNQSRGLWRVGEDIAETLIPSLAEGQEDDPLAGTREKVAQAWKDVSEMITYLNAWVAESFSGTPETVYYVGLNTTRLLLAMGDVLIGWLLLKQADIASGVLSGRVSSENSVFKPSDRFLSNKILTARWFADNRLPSVSAELETLKNTDVSALEVEF